MQDPGAHQGLISLYTWVIRKLDVLKMLIITPVFLRTYSFSVEGGCSAWGGGTLAVV
jgi:hypothetical protein